MCERASFLAWYDGSLDWDLESDAHSGLILKRYATPPLDHHVQPYTKIECTPRADPFSLNRNDWEVVVDEDDNPPLWFHIEDWQDRILDELINKRIPKERETGIIGTLTITAANKKSYDWIVKAGRICVACSAFLELPKLREASSIILSRNAGISFPELLWVTHTFSIDGYNLVSIPKCTGIACLVVDKYNALEFPSVTHIGEFYGDASSIVKLPVCVAIDTPVQVAAQIEAPRLVPNMK